MKYQYHCNHCKTTFLRNRPVTECSLPSPCECGQEAGRIFSANFQVCTDRLADRPENKYALGFDETTRRETMKADDAKYEKAWAGKTPSAPEAPKESLVDTYRNLYPEHARN